jgi:hypothetical protein
MENESPKPSPRVRNAPEAPPATAAAGTEKLTPNEWARRKALLVEASPEKPWVEQHATGFHAEAEQLHGWAWHSQNYQSPEQAFRLTEADYDAALAAAAEFPAKPAHEAAIPNGYPKPVVPKHIADACAVERAKAEKKG